MYVSRLQQVHELVQCLRSSTASSIPRRRVYFVVRISYDEDALGSTAILCRHLRDSLHSWAYDSLLQYRAVKEIAGEAFQRASRFSMIRGAARPGPSSTRYLLHVRIRVDAVDHIRSLKSISKARMTRSRSLSRSYRLTLQIQRPARSDSWL